MFPYLKMKKDFLMDCESVRFRIEEEDIGSYKIVEEDVRAYSATRGCSYNNTFCKGLCGHTRCERIPHRNDRQQRVYYADPCRDCNNISELSAVLTENVNNSNWKAKRVEGHNYIGSVDLLMLQSWCQSFGVYMHDVIKQIKNENILVGLELYLDKLQEGDNHVRADVIIVGYGYDGNGKMIVVELKQDDNSADNIVGKVSEAVRQVKSYYESINQAAVHFDELNIDIVPCVYFHNYTNKESVRDSVDDTFVFYGGIQRTEDKTEGIHQMVEFINGELDCDSTEDPWDIIKKYKKDIRTLSVSDIASIIMTDRTTDGFEAINLLRPDQKYVYDEIIEQINGLNGNSGGNINIVRGASGSGKTFLTALIINYCKERNLDWCMDYKGTAPINAIFNESLPQFAGENDDVESILQNNLIRNDDTIIDLLDRLNGRNIFIYDEFHRFQDYKYDEENNLANMFQNVLMYSGVSILFIDELQEVFKKDIGSSYIFQLMNNTNLANCKKREYNLWSQFRCNRCEGYVTWVEQILQLESNERNKYVVRNDNYSSRIHLNDLDFDVEILDKEDLINYENIIRDEGIFLLTDLKKSAEGLFGNTVLGNWEKTNTNVNIDPNGNIKVGIWNNVQGLEFAKILVVIDERIDYLAGRISYTEKFREDILCKTRSYSGTELSSIPQDLKDEINTDYFPGREKQVASWKVVCEELSRVRNISLEEARCKVCQDYFDDYINKSLEFTKRRYRLLLTRGLKKCAIYAVNENLRNYLKHF